MYVSVSFIVHYNLFPDLSVCIQNSCLSRKLVWQDFENQAGGKYAWEMCADHLQDFKSCM